MNAPRTPREALAYASDMCEYAVQHASPHDHEGCLAEADKVIKALQVAGYRITAFGDLATMKPPSEPSRCGHPQCLCNRA